VSRTPVVVYGVLAVAGLVGSWYFNLLFFATEPGASYVGSWFANAASSSAAVDLIVVATAACVLMVREGRRLGMAPWALVTLVVLSFAVAVSFTFPLFLALRERRLALRAGEAGVTPDRGTTRAGWGGSTL
jgi:hypothetical protein